MFSVILFVLIGFLSSGTYGPQHTNDAIMKLEQRFTAGLLKRDHAELNELLADDLVHIGFEGQFAGKAEYLTFFQHGDWSYKKYEPQNMTVKVFGNVAIVTGRVDRTIVVSGRQTTGAFAFTHVWSRTEDRWRMTSSQVTTVPAPAPGSRP